VSEIAKALEDVAQKAEQGLSRDFSQAYHDILKDTEQKATQVADHVAENEARTAESLASSAERDAAGAVSGPHEPAEGGGGLGPHGGAEPSLGEHSGPGQPSAGNGGCTTAGDPVDVVSGQMITSAVDLHLPGLLPLVLRRAYASGFAAGRWFGPGWSSTLDQRVEIDARGIHYVGEDAQILTYPLPTASEPYVLPEHGARWPLRWDRASDVISITDPASGWTRHFPATGAAGAPAPGPRPIGAVTDRNGHGIDFSYDEQGLPTEVRHSGGYLVAVDHVGTPRGPRIAALRVLHSADGADGGADGAADSGGASGTTVRSYAYDAAGRLAGITDSSGAAFSYEHDAADRITRWTDRNGFWYGYEYAPSGRVARGFAPGNVLAAEFAYDPLNQVTAVTDSLGRTTSYHYDEHRHVVRTVDPLGHTVLTERDERGRVLSRTDEIGRRTRYDFDDRGELRRITAPDGSTIDLTHNDSGQLTSVTQAGIRTALFAYDERGNLTSSTDALGATTTRRYDDRGHLVSVTDPLGLTRTFESNDLGLVTALTDPLGNTARVSYDAFGRAVLFTDPLGAVTRLAYRVEGQVTERTNPDGSRETWTYDPEGQVVEYRGPSGATTRCAYGPFGRLVERILPDGEVQSFGYDTELRLTEAGTGTGRWQYTYDAAGHLIGETDLNGRTLSYRNDGADQLQAIVDSGGRTTSFRYDLRGDLVERREHDGSITEISYDVFGRPLRIADHESVVEYSRDPAGRVLTETVDGHTTTYAYDALGRLRSRTTPSGITSTWTYDAGARPLSLGGPHGALTFAHDANGREVLRGLSEGVSLAQTWDVCGRLTGQAVLARDSAGTTPENYAGATPSNYANVQERRYSYRPDGVPSAVTDRMRGSRQFELSPGGRVLGVRGDTWSESYSYDPLGNIVRAHDSRRAQAAAQGERQLTGSLLQSSGRVHYDYDDQGRLVRALSRTLSGQRREWQYSWDARDRLVRVDTPDRGSWVYRYDPIGRRTAKAPVDPDGGVRAVAYAWHGTELAEERADFADGSVRTRTWDHAPGSGTPLAQTERFSPGAGTGTGAGAGAGTGEQPQPAGDARFWAIVTDLVGAPSELIAADGSIAWAAAADLWGRPLRPRRGPIDCPFAFPGQYLDEESGLAYNYFRYYDPATGRYLTSDPLGQGAGPNPHGYVPNPLFWIDPLGLAKKQPSGMGGWYGSLQPANWTDGSDTTRYEINHMPAQASYKSLGLGGGDLNPRYGPSIRMEYDDHRNFISTGSGPGPDAWRAQQSSLIRQGKFDEAIKMDIDEIRRVHGPKYDSAIKEMVDSIPNNEKLQQYLKDNGWKIRTCILQ
jgi:RHS repeat-associated protein